MVAAYSVLHDKYCKLVMLVIFLFFNVRQHIDGKRSVNFFLHMSFAHVRVTASV